MTILYDTTTNTILSKHENGYFIDGVKPTLPQGIVELEIIYTTRPDINNITEVIEEEWVISETNYSQSFKIRKKTPSEDWTFQQFSKRVKAPITLIMEDIGAA